MRKNETFKVHGRKLGPPTSDEVRLAAAKECLRWINITSCELPLRQNLPDCVVSPNWPNRISSEHETTMYAHKSNKLRDSAIKRCANHELVYLVDVPKHLDKKIKRAEYSRRYRSRMVY